MAHFAYPGSYSGLLHWGLPAQHGHAAKVLLDPVGRERRAGFHVPVWHCCVRGRTGASCRSAANDPMVVPNHRCGSTWFPGLLCSCLLALACPLGLATAGQQLALNDCFDSLFLLPSFLTEGRCFTGLLPALRFSPRYGTTDFIGVRRVEGAHATIIALAGIVRQLSPPPTPACHTNIAAGIGPTGATHPPCRSTVSGCRVTFETELRVIPRASH